MSDHYTGGDVPDLLLSAEQWARALAMPVVWETLPDDAPDGRGGTMKDHRDGHVHWA